MTHSYPPRPATALYDTIGRGYAARRQPDPRIAGALAEALAGSATLANIGAGTGSYEPAHKTVIAIEPSMEMLRQRPPGSAPAVQAVAENLPLKDNCVAAATAILTIHHWTSLARGLEGLARIARERVAILTWDPDAPAFWLTDEYFPSMVERDRKRFPRMSGFPGLEGVETGLARLEQDLESGQWARRFGHLLDRESLDIGYRLVVAELN